MAEEIGIFVEDAERGDILIDEKNFTEYISKDIKRNLKVKIRGVEFYSLGSIITENGNIITSTGEKVTITDFYNIAYGQTPEIIVDGVPIGEPRPPRLAEAYRLFNPDGEVAPQLKEFDKESAARFDQEQSTRTAQERIQTTQQMNGKIPEPRKTPPAEAKTETVPGRTGESFTINERNDLATQKGFKEAEGQLNQTARDVNTQIQEADKNGKPRGSLTPEQFGFKHLSLKAFSKLIDGVSYLFEKYGKFIIPYGLLVGLIYEVTIAHQKAINGCYLVKTDPKTGTQTQQKIELLTCGDAKTDTIASVSLLGTCQTIDYSTATNIQDCTGSFNPCANPNDTSIFNRGKDKKPVPPYVPNVCNTYYAEQAPAAVDGVTVKAPTCNSQDTFTSAYCQSDNFFLLPGESIKSVNMDFWSSLTDLALGIGSDIVNPLLKVAEGILEGPGDTFGAAVKKFLIILAIVVVVGLLIFWVLGLLKKKAEKSFLG